MATATHVQVHVRHQIVPIVRHVLMVTDQSVVMIVVRQVIDQQVVHTETAIHVHHHVQVLIVRVAKTHTVVIAHAQAMIATLVRRRVTANAVADQIVPEVVSPMIAKSVHAVALAKSALTFRIRSFRITSLVTNYHAQFVTNFAHFQKV
jgi:hypothetical protein